jgi:integrase
LATALTDAAVRKFRPAKERREIRDSLSQGLYLVIQPSGSRSWAMRFRRPDGSPGKLTLGSVDLSGKEAQGDPVLGTPLTLAAARALASEVHRQRKMGRDVIADYVAKKQRFRIESEAAVANSFGALAPQFIAEYARPKTRRWRATARMLGLRYPKDGETFEIIHGGLSHRWASKPVRDITKHDIQDVVDEARDRGVPGLVRHSEGPTEGQARSMLSTLSTFFGWVAKRKRLIEMSPCTVHRPEAPKSRDRVLTDAEIRIFWKSCDAVSEPFSQALKMLLITGCRLSEVSQMRRDELSEDGSTWNIPGLRTKNHRPHVVPLPPLARSILATVKLVSGDFMFTTTGRSPISGWARVKARLDSEMSVPSWRLHDLRRTAATGMAEIGIAPHIVEAALNHVSGARAGVAGTYNRAAYSQEKRAALERWGAHVEDLIHGHASKVLTFSTPRGGRA